MIALVEEVARALALDSNTAASVDWLRVSLVGAAVIAVGLAIAYLWQGTKLLRRGFAAALLVGAQLTAPHLTFSKPQEVRADHPNASRPGADRVVQPLADSVVESKSGRSTDSAARAVAPSSASTQEVQRIGAARVALPPQAAPRIVSDSSRPAVAMVDSTTVGREVASGERAQARLDSATRRLQQPDTALTTIAQTAPVGRSSSPAASSKPSSLPALMQGSMYADLSGLGHRTGSSPTTPLTYGTLDLSADLSSVVRDGIQVGLTLEGNFSRSAKLVYAGNVVQKFRVQSPIVGRALQLGLRKTFGDGSQPVSLGLLSRIGGGGVKFSPELWVSQFAGNGSAKRRRAALLLLPVQYRALGATSALFAAPGRASDWQVTGSLTLTSNRVIPFGPLTGTSVTFARDFTSSDVAVATHIAPDWGQYRLGAARNVGTTTVSAYRFWNATREIKKGLGLTLSVPLGPTALRVTSP